MKSRGGLGAKPALRRLNASMIVLYDRQRRLLMQHRTPDAWIQPDHWAFFGGAIDGGETPEQAVRREALEELGHVLRSPRLLRTVRFRQLGFQGRIHVFTEPFFGDKSRLELREGQGWGWFRLCEMGPLLMVKRDREIAAAVDAALRGRRVSPGGGGR